MNVTGAPALSLAVARKYSYTVLLISLTLIVLGSDFLGDGTAAVSNAVTTVIGAVSIIFACICVSPSAKYLKRTLLFTAMSAIMWVLATCVNASPFNTIAFQSVTLMLAFLVLMCLTIWILQDISRSPVTADRICGAVCVYMFIGIAFADLFTLTETLAPNSFKFANSSDENRQGLTMDNAATMTYFSFSTLTTAGYGDVAPGTKFTRSLAWIEAAAGQMYLSILIARLVGLYMAEELARRTEKLQEE